MKPLSFLASVSILSLALLVAATLLFSQPARVDTQTSNNSLDAAGGGPHGVVYVDANGNVGIGTQTPETHLAPSGRTLLISDVPDASPTASSHLQGCQHELGHGLCPIPVNSSS